MQKTVQVVDEAGIRYEATWERRARGLVKNGRARFIDENTICLACPPNKQNIISEDMKMTNTENRKENNFTSEETALTAKYSLEYALEQIERIANDVSVIMKALDTISTVDNEPTLEKGGSADELAKLWRRSFAAGKPPIKGSLRFMRKWWMTASCDARTSSPPKFELNAGVRRYGKTRCNSV